MEIRPGAGVVVAAGSGALLLERVQLAGRDEQRADELAVRTGLAMGERLGGDEAAGERA
jgi:methionyl-tRNA formyltransferase